MKIKLDENMPTELLAALQGLGHEVDTVPQEKLTGEPDTVVQDAARIEARFLVTQDKKFIDERSWMSNPGPGVMLVRVDNEDRGKLIQVVLEAFSSQPVDTWSGCIVVVTRTRVRVRTLDRKDSL